MPGESMTIKHYTLTYESVDQYETQSKLVATATLSVYNRGKLIGKLTPEKYFHRSHGRVTEVAIRSTLLEDLYVIPVTRFWDDDGTIVFDEDGPIVFKVLVNPLVNWIWIGGGVLVLGGLIAFWPERRKLPAPQQDKARSK